MNNKELGQYLEELNRTWYALEQEYTANEGECTESTEAKEAAIVALKEIIENEGIDSLGQWLKRVQDESAARKAEKDFCARREKACKATEDYIKSCVAYVMETVGKDKIKGDLGYSFSTRTATEIALDKEEFNKAYQAKIEEALRNSGLPSWIKVSLDYDKTQIKEMLEQGETLPELFAVTTSKAVTFRKPIARTK